MSSSSSSSQSGEYDDVSNNGSDKTHNSSERYSSSASSSSSSSSSSSASEVPAVQRGEKCDMVAMARMDREQRLRRLLSQRKVGEAVYIDDGKNTEPFTFRKGTLDTDDAILLATFSNAVLFSKLKKNISRQGSRDSSPNARVHGFDDALGSANPFYYRAIKALLLDLPPMVAPRRMHMESEALDNSGILVQRRKRQCDGDGGALSRAAEETAARRLRQEEAAAARGISSSSSMIAKSLHAWENHLSKELAAEGVSLDSFREQRMDSSFLEKRRFLEDSQWADYQREIQLDEKRREQIAKRAIRRGEATDQT